MRTPVKDTKLIKSLGTKDSDKTPLKMKHYQVVKLWHEIVNHNFNIDRMGDAFKTTFTPEIFEPMRQKCLDLKFDKFGIVKVRVRRVSKKIEYDDAYIYVKRHFPGLINKIEAELY